jgi:hypothetical protein
MTIDPSETEEPTAQARESTDYAATTASGAKPGFVLSAWSLILGGVFLVLILAGLLLI